MSRAILVMQPGPNPLTRTYADFDSVNECIESVCKIYEEHLKRSNPHKPSITYDISQLFDFIDQLADLSCLVYQKSTTEAEEEEKEEEEDTYVIYKKDWIKEKIYVLLRRQAGEGE